MRAHIFLRQPGVLLLQKLKIMKMILVSCVTKNSSLMICGNLIDRTNPAQNVAEFRDVRKWLTQNKIKSFYSPLFSTSFRQGASSLLQISGLGKFRPNVLFMGETLHLNKFPVKLLWLFLIDLSFFRVQGKLEICSSQRC